MLLAESAAGVNLKLGNQKFEVKFLLAEPLSLNC